MRSLALVFLALCWAPAHAWGPAGHRMVGQIAQWELDREARREVQELLRGKSLAKVSTWADEIRGIPEWDYLSPHHYVNLDPRVGEFRGCPEQGCIIDAIRDALRTLEDKSQPAQERATSLRLLVHFVGDLHQPLHVSHAADRGGNLMEILFFDRPSNLHAIWDSGILSRKRESWRKRARRLLRQSDQSSEQWLEGSMVDWAHESYRLAIEVVYPSSTVSELGSAYVLTHEQLVERRVAQAGLRLGWLLNRVLGG